MYYQANMEKARAEAEKGNVIGTVALICDAWQWEDDRLPPNASLDARRILLLANEKSLYPAILADVEFVLACLQWRHAQQYNLSPWREYADTAAP